MAKVSESEELLKNYFSKNQIVIVDSVSSARVTLASQIAKMGGIRQKMELLSSVDEARLVIDKTKPKIIFTDYSVAGQSGLDLLQVQKTEYEKQKVKDSLFVMVTSNASQSTVARAAEEDVDTFVIKPYTGERLKTALFNAIKGKLQPSLYIQLIEQGKEMLIAGQIPEAIDFFSKAMKEHPEPTLACFYFGQAEFMQEALIGAEKKYSQGLSYNKIHYKCLVGLYDLLINAGKNYEAYDVVKKIAQYFPANPKRLTSVLRLAMTTDNFHDMEGYYQIFIKLEERSEELTKAMCSALAVTGKYYLRQKVKNRALEVFQNASVSAGPMTQFLLYIVEALVDHKFNEEAEKFYQRLCKTGTGGKDQRIAEFALSSLVDGPEKAIQLGRTLIKDGIDTVSVYERLIQQTQKAGQPELAQQLCDDAVKKFPASADKFTFFFQAS